MKKVLFLLLLIFEWIQIFSQNITVVDKGNLTRPTPKIGLNSNGHLPADCPSGSKNKGAHWKQVSFIDSVASLYPEILRYPGGTVANHWDWGTGWYKSGYGPPCSTLNIGVKEFSAGLTASKANGLYVLNLETSNPAEQTNALRNAILQGPIPYYIELGNEHNLVNHVYKNQLMTETNYANISKLMYDSMIKVLPNAKFCIVGGKNAQWATWPASVQNILNLASAVSWHPYPNAQNADLKYDLNRALSIPFGPATLTGSLENMYQFGHFNSTLLSNKEIWVTEYNLNEIAVSSKPIIANTWGHFLYMNAMHHYFLSNPKITMFLNHAAASIDTFHTSIRIKDQSLTANAIAMKLLLGVSRDSKSCTQLTFSGNHIIHHPNGTIPKLTGWLFDFDQVNKGFICNYSSDTFHVALSKLFNHSIQYHQYHAYPQINIYGVQNIKETTGITQDTLLVLPFSFTQMTSNFQLNTSFTNPQKYNLEIYPNPSYSTIYIKSNVSLDGLTYEIYDVEGKLHRKINHLAGSQIEIERKNLHAGAYLIHLYDQNSIIAIKKFIILE